MNQIALYIHVPFCVRKCRYCDFNSVADARVTHDDYVAGVVKEMAMRAWSLPGPVRAGTLYMGGGTPSLLSPRLMALLLEAAVRHYLLAPDAEVTMEANPGTVTPESLAGYREAGVNRLSLGIQSFQDRFLKLLGRVHTGDEAVRAVEQARGAGFDNLGLDLMHSLPGETLLHLEEDLAQAVRLQPNHLSAYPLAVEEGTSFAEMEGRGELQLPSEEESAAMLELTSGFLTAAGYDHYEIANYAHPGFASRHNRVYWRRGDYLGFGAGAHSFLRSPGYGIRWHNREAIADYLREVTEDRLPDAGPPAALSAREAMGEFLYLGLRLLKGVEEERFRQEFGMRPEEAFPVELHWLLEKRLLKREGGRLRLSPRAVPVANQVFFRFV